MANEKRETERPHSSSAKMTGEGESSGPEGIVGGRSEIAAVGRLDESATSTTGRIGREEMMATGGTNNIGSEGTTRTPDDQVDVEGDTTISHGSGVNPGTVTGAAADEG